MVEPVGQIDGVAPEDLLYYLAGLDSDGRSGGPRPPWPALAQFMLNHLFGGRQQWMDLWLTEHDRTTERIGRRAHKLGDQRAQILADLLVAESMTAPPQTFLEYETDASNYYALLRMLAPNVDKGRACPADSIGGVTPRAIIVYAGDSHCRHIYRVLRAVVGAEWPDLARSRRSKLVQFVDVEVRGTDPCDNGGDVLDRLLA
jgi:hypothetical protein